MLCLLTQMAPGYKEGDQQMTTTVHAKKHLQAPLPVFYYLISVTLSPLINWDVEDLLHQFSFFSCHKLQVQIKEFELVDYMYGLYYTIN